MDRSGAPRRTAFPPPSEPAVPPPRTDPGATRFPEFCGNGLSPRQAATLLKYQPFLLVSIAQRSAHPIYNSRQFRCILLQCNHLEILIFLAALTAFGCV